MRIFPFIHMLNIGSMLWQCWKMVWTSKRQQIEGSLETIVALPLKAMKYFLMEFWLLWLNNTDSLHYEALRRITVLTECWWTDLYFSLSCNFLNLMMFPPQVSPVPHVFLKSFVLWSSVLGLRGDGDDRPGSAFTNPTKVFRKTRKGATQVQEHR